MGEHGKQVVGLTTIQVVSGQLGVIAKRVHLAVDYEHGTGQIICGIDRHALECGFSVGGGLQSINEPCHLCNEVAERMRFTAELPVVGLHRDLFDSIDGIGPTARTRPGRGAAWPTIGQTIR